MLDNIIPLNVRLPQTGQVVKKPNDYQHKLFIKYNNKPSLCMPIIQHKDRAQLEFWSLDDCIDEHNPVRFIDAFA